MKYKIKMLKTVCSRTFGNFSIDREYLVDEKTAASLIDRGAATCDEYKDTNTVDKEVIEEIKQILAARQTQVLKPDVQEATIKNTEDLTEKRTIPKKRKYTRKINHETD
jgi:hypothetical protein